MKLEGELGYAGRKRREEIEDTSSRAKWGTQHASAYRPLLGSFPALPPDDRTGARKVVRRIDEVLEKGGWTRGESRRLHRMRQKWAARTQGQDARFVVVGSYRGGLTEEQRVRIKDYQLTLQNNQLIRDSQSELEKSERERTIGNGNKQRPNDDTNAQTADRGRARSTGTHGWGRD